MNNLARSTAGEAARGIHQIPAPAQHGQRAGRNKAQQYKVLRIAHWPTHCRSQPIPAGIESSANELAREHTFRQP